ncbi:hypothetical protein R3P38DRAFT_2774430 [Favolaschia claudopus]|uniref:Uncharacterized protein n=1 Tax=Favolaschia claudopus TaxID=2862362 RepID=A0AAW0BXY0_9AGAR
MAALYRFDYIEILPASRGFRNASGEQHIRSRTSDLTRVESPTFSENQFFAVRRATFAKLCQPRRSASLAVQRPARLKPNRKFDFLASAERRFVRGLVQARQTSNQLKHSETTRQCLSGLLGSL